MGKHWVRTEDGPVEVEELEYCPYCQELTDPETGQCDNIYCGQEEEKGECEECGGVTYNNESYCDVCLSSPFFVEEMNDAADFMHGTGAYE